MRWYDFLIFVVLLALLSGGLYFLWLNFPTEPVEFEEYQANISREFPLESTQFFPNMRYADKEIGYSISLICTAKRKLDFERAVAVLGEKTVLSFYESDEPEIIVSCSDIAPEPDEENHFIAGEGGPALVINASRYFVIAEGKIALFRPESCDTPQIAVHELLHALGFNHNSNEESILYPVTDCKQKIDQYVIDEIDRLYSQQSLADLVVESVKANKTGRYLNFKVSVANYGLKKAGDSRLILISDGEETKEFEIGEMDVGMSRYLSVSNLGVHRNTERISFVVRTLEPEITKENNEVEMAVAQP